jgi:D-alanyl-D-alanine carboxypeptidase (penicillin-binding protein 5/6)
MKNTVQFIIGTLLLIVSCHIFAAPPPMLVPAPPHINARGYLLMDFNSGQILVEDNADEKMEPASLTKMMTCYVIEHEIAAGNISLDDKVLISKKAWKMPGSRMFVEVNSRVSVRELLKGIIVQSGNDATVALAEFVAGSEDAFASLMNQYAKKLGMVGTHFVNSTGLPNEDHFTTPRDMAIMARALISEFPEQYDMYSIKKFTYNNITQYNRNRLLWRDKFVDGVKTGHTESAGYCLVASALRDNMRLISVVLGTKSENARADESQKLLSYGFRFFETHKLYTANEPLTEVTIWKGEKDKLPLGLNRDLWVTVPRGQYDKLKASMKIDSTILAPIAKGQQYGIVTVKLGDESYAQRELIALEHIGEGGLFNNLVDEVKLLFQ